MKKKYIIEVTKGKQQCLNKLTSAGIVPGQILNRARILLKADVGEEHAGSWALLDHEIAEMLETVSVVALALPDNILRKTIRRIRVSAACSNRVV